jgi:hypothetical protein
VIISAAATAFPGLARPAAADILHVPGDYPTIQAALSAASDGDEIVVADGNYSGSGFRNINFSGLAVTVRSASGDPNLCTLDCQQSGRGFTFDNDETAESVLEGFTLAWGFAADDGVGGAIFVAGAMPTIRNCIFSSCNALVDGGAVYVDGASPSFSDCTFESNTANHNGGGACINGGSPVFTNCAFDANQAFGHGGGLYVANGMPDMNGCEIADNTAAVDGGGAYITQGSSSFADCMIRANSAGDDGGGMYVYQASLDLTACTFDANVGLDGGGGLCYISVEDCTISDSGFADNEGAFGGGIYLARVGGIEPTMTLENCSFTGNTMPPEVNGYGGGVYVDEALLIANDCVFNGNGASANGGAAFIEGAFTATNTDFIYNFANGAHGGGAIAADGADVTLTECLFDDNHALTTTEGGGAIRLVGGSVSATGCEFNANSAPASGGALYISSGEATLIDCTLADNSITLDNDELDGGGAIYTDSDGTINLNGCSLSHNFGIDRGGALYCQLDSNTLISNCAFIGNQAPGTDTPGLGGAIYAYSALFVADSRFESNSSSDGGAVSGNGTFVNCEFVDNTSSGAGGAVFNQFGLYLYELAFVNCRFIGNQSQSDGGALFADVGVSQGTWITGCEFIGNAAVHWGGAVHAQTYTTPLGIANCTFWANSTLESGGGLHIATSQDGVASVYNSIVRGNSPDQINLIDALEVSYCDIEDGWAGNGSHNIDADPLFIDPEGLDGIPGTADDNLRLLPLSPCIDAADNTAVPADEFDLDEDGNTSEPIPFDLDGDDRFVDDPATEDTGNGTPPIVDMGTYEFQACPADFDHDDDVDTADLLHLLGAWGTAEGDTDYDGDTDTADLLTLLGTWGECP